MSYNFIGSGLRLLGRHEEALEYLQKALRIRKEIFGERHPEVVEIYMNIGISLNALGKRNEALENYQKGLQIITEFFGERHPFATMSYSPYWSVFTGLR